ncbi:DUF6053 domain-containing protein [Lysobacter enzymogenes]|uniref:DUF6053 domain-containing protein n=1 Tax=Lysobacter enzymogenes TaxID=69 RepID=UPI003D18ECC6
MPSAQVAASWHKSVGAQAPPTRAGRDAAGLRLRLRQATRRRGIVSKPSWSRSFRGRDFSPDAFRSDRRERAQKRRG